MDENLTPSHNDPKRYAAIDIGTVTCRLLIADVPATGEPDLAYVSKLYAVTNLGEGVDATSRLKEEAIERVVEALLDFKSEMDRAEAEGAPIEKVTVMSTSAARDAENSDDFAVRLEEIDLSLDVIPGAQEAALSFAGATISCAGKAAMVVDVGGGSTEISLGVGGDAPVCSRSFDIGCRRVTERFLASDPPTEPEMDDARAWMREQFDAWFAEPDVASQLDEQPQMIAVAGTATSAVSIRDHMEVYDSERVDGATVTLEELREITNDLAAMTLDERRHVVGLDPRRAPVIVAGMIILEEVMLAGGKTSFQVSESDILDGMILYSVGLGQPTE